MITSSPLSGLLVSVIASASDRDAFKLRRRTAWTSIPQHISESDTADAVLLVREGGASVIAVPFSKMGGGKVLGRFGGRFITTSDSRLREIAPYPIPLYDADEEIALSPGVFDEYGALVCDVLFSDHRGCALFGPTEYFDQVRVYDTAGTPEGVNGPDVLVHTAHRTVKGYFYAVPQRFIDPREHTMMGGNFIYSNSEAFCSMFGPYPVPVHDRCESTAARERAGYFSRSCVAQVAPVMAHSEQVNA